MPLSTIALIIVGIMCVLYIWGKLPVALVTALGMLALIFSGCVSSSVAFSNFGSTPVLLVFGMVIIVNAILESGLVTKYEHILERMTRKSEKGFLILVFLSAGIISMFTNNTALVAMFMPFITSVAKGSSGKIRRKHIYLPLAMGGLIGGTGSLAGSTAPLLANEVLEITGQKTFGFFTTAPVCLAIMAVIALCYWFFLYDLTVKWFDFDETDEHENTNQEIQLNRKNAVVSVTVFLACVVLFITRPFGWDLGLISVAGAAVIIVFKCVDIRKELSNMMWPAIITLGCALAVADGFVKSGAGDVVIDFLISVFGVWLTNPKVMVALFLGAGWLISMFMSNGSLVSMLAAIAIPMAIDYQINPIPIAIACAVGANLAMATPVATTTITMVQVAGYRFKDYFRVGGLVGLISIITAWASIVLLYGL